VIALCHEFEVTAIGHELDVTNVFILTWQLGVDEFFG